MIWICIGSRDGEKQADCLVTDWNVIYKSSTFGIIIILSQIYKLVTSEMTPVSSNIKTICLILCNTLGPVGCEVGQRWIASWRCSTEDLLSSEVRSVPRALLVSSQHWAVFAGWRGALTCCIQGISCHWVVFVLPLCSCGWNMSK